MDEGLRRSLEETRDFLLRSLDDLEREYAAGDVDDHDYGTLRADYTRRAATVVRRLQGASTETVAGRPGRQRWVTALGVLAVAALAGVLVMQSSGRRGSGGLTGLDVTAASARAESCLVLEQEGDPEGALACYDDVLEEVPADATALTYRGWLQVRSFSLAAGLGDLDAAVQLAPDASATRIFRASARSRGDDPVGALADLAAFWANDPGADEAALARQLGGGIVDRAVDACIVGEVGGTLDVVAVLECYRNALVVDDGHPVASIYLGWLLARSGVDDERALELLDQGLAADPSLTAGFIFRAALRAHLGDVEGARADLEELDVLELPADQISAAAQVQAAIDAGRDPLETGAEG